ncbi:MAG TPA: transcriptional regulator [Armatimonadetes bacterium]|nr:transcriptional regulator [Armatimonadota bacterium]
MKQVNATDTCDFYLVNEEAVQRVRRAWVPEEQLIRLAETFKALGDPTRARILFALSQAELCVCDLSSLLDVSPSAVSHQLRLLRQQRLVKYRREGRMAFYSLDDDHIRHLLAEGLRHVQEEA